MNLRALPRCCHHRVCEKITKGTLPTMSLPPPNAPILELRVAVTTMDYERLLKFYTIGLGIEPAQFWQNGQGHAAILNLGRATLEIFDEAQAQAIDEIEVGQRVSGPFRFA